MRFVVHLWRRTYLLALNGVVIVPETVFVGLLLSLAHAYTHLLLLLQAEMISINVSLSLLAFYSAFFDLFTFLSFLL